MTGRAKEAVVVMGCAVTIWAFAFGPILVLVVAVAWKAVGS